MPGSADWLTDQYDNRLFERNRERTLQRLSATFRRAELVETLLETVEA